MLPTASLIGDMQRQIVNVQLHILDLGYQPLKQRIRHRRLARAEVDAIVAATAVVLHGVPVGATKPIKIAAYNECGM
jgi:hypothetical protein